MMRTKIRIGGIKMNDKVLDIIEDMAGSEDTKDIVLLRTDTEGRKFVVSTLDHDTTVDLLERAKAGVLPDA